MSTLPQDAFHTTEGHYLNASLAAGRKGDGHHSWSEAEIAQFEARHPVGSRARLALALGLYTAQRGATESKVQKRELKPAHFYQGCIFAWNAYREGKTITSIKFDTKKGLVAVHE